MSDSWTELAEWADESDRLLSPLATLDEADLGSPGAVSHGGGSSSSGALLVQQESLTPAGLMVRAAIALGNRDENALTNLVFFARHPERDGRRLDAAEPGFDALSKEWVDIRNTVVRPLLRPASPPSGGPLTLPAVATQLPAAGAGYTTSGTRNRYGVPETIRALEWIGAEWGRRHPDVTFMVRDISKRGGGQFGKHKSHRIGLDADVQLWRDGKKMNVLSTTDYPAFRPYVQALVDLIESNPVLPVKTIGILDRTLKGRTVAPWAGHVRHLHVRFCMPPGRRAELDVRKVGGTPASYYACAAGQQESPFHESAVAESPFAGAPSAESPFSETALSQGQPEASGVDDLEAEFPWEGEDDEPAGAEEGELGAEAEGWSRDEEELGEDEPAELPPGQEALEIGETPLRPVVELLPLVAEHEDGLLDRLRGLASFAFGESLRRGSSGPAVAVLQTALTRLGHPLVADGDFGPATERAVRAFQAAQSLTVDGVVGPQTRQAVVAAVTGTSGRPAATGTSAGPSAAGTSPRAAASGRRRPRTTQQLRNAWDRYRCEPAEMVTVQVLSHRTPVNRVAVDAFAALDRALRATGYQARRTWAYNCRPIAGTARYSLHSYGTAVDIDPRENPHRKGTTGPVRFSAAASRQDRAADVASGVADTVFTPEQVAAVEAIRTVDGHPVWAWGGRWGSSHDTMHFQVDCTPEELARGLDARTLTSEPVERERPTGSADPAQDEVSSGGPSTGCGCCSGHEASGAG